MIIVSGIKIPYELGDGAAVDAALSELNIDKSSVTYAGVYKLSFDLRRGRLRKVYAIKVEISGDPIALVARLNRPDIRLLEPAAELVVTGKNVLPAPPVVVGFGPCGMFAALSLARMGFKPVIIERGGDMSQRDALVDVFQKSGVLNTNTNVQFGEGGAGAYSDGKLTTRIHDPRAQLVTKCLIEHGAPPEITLSAKPHIGTDLLKGIVVSIRGEIISLGGTFHFNTTFLKTIENNGSVTGVATDKGDIPCNALVLAIGHSARDTYAQLFKSGILVEPKNFAVGFRFEHLQSDINAGLYGDYATGYNLPQGEYALSHTAQGRGCYSFCMCPGGKVVSCPSEEGGLAVNGMSYHARNGCNANSAIVVGVSSADFGADPLGGIAFQRTLEQAAFAKGGGGFVPPMQTLGDFMANRPSSQLGKVTPSCDRGYNLTDLNGILPSSINDTIKAAVPIFGQKIQGFDCGETLLSGVESRTSSPVRIVRDCNMESVSTQGLYPCGEGAGYAGGIMSAAVDGIRAAQSIMAKFKPRG